MSFADIYLSRQSQLFPTPTPDNQLSGVIVIPCYSEPQIYRTLFSLLQTTPTQGVFEVIIVVNYPETAPTEAAFVNQRLFEELQHFANKNQLPQRKIRPVWLGKVPKKKAGAGYARKIGMDMAVSMLNLLNQEDGIILSLDADTTVSPNYLAEAEKVTKNHSVRQIIFPFEHPKKELTDEFCRAITLYEMHLRYYRLALRYVGWPWAFHTIGSAFGVKAFVYAEQNGMNTKTAGEDFYFLNKLFPHGGTKVLTKCRVYPEARLSDRVPFGTGPAMQKILQSNLQYETYCFESFKTIEYFLRNLPEVFNSSKSAKDFVARAPEPLKQFWIDTDMEEKITESLHHSASVNTFTKRMLRKFDAFQLVKYLNFAHENFFSRKPVEEEATKLLHALQKPADNSSPETILTLLEQVDESME